ncbi:MAG: hypothetical protein M1834_002341 [Cirrosporium novae-zelandiae]|nr:MAG: hypothetical protein M1834_002341 [Cirrosporium novae-zelandiae]
MPNGPIRKALIDPIEKDVVRFKKRTDQRSLRPKSSSRTILTVPGGEIENTLLVQDSDYSVGLSPQALTLAVLPARLACKSIRVFRTIISEKRLVQNTQLHRLVDVGSIRETAHVCLVETHGFPATSKSYLALSW